MATKCGGQSQREKSARQRQITQSKITDHTPQHAMASSPLADANSVNASAMDMTELVWEVTRNINAVMEQKFSKLADALEKIASSLEGQSQRITEAEQQISTVEDQVVALERCLEQVQSRQVSMAEQLDDAENRSRWDNIRILNLKEGTEGEHPLQFFESWLPTTLGLPAAKGRIKLDRAHRAGGPRSDRPRPVIIKLHNSRDKLRILSAARKAKNLEHGGSRIFIHQDLSNAVRQKRRSFNDVVQKLIYKGIRFTMRFPARLVVQHNGAERSLDNAEEAQHFVDMLN